MARIPLEGEMVRIGGRAMLRSIGAPHGVGESRCPAELRSPADNAAYTKFVRGVRASPARTSYRDSPLASFECERLL